MTEFVEPISEYFGISSDILIIAVLFMFTLSISMVMTIFTGSYRLGILGSSGVMIVAGFMGLIPIWLIIMVVLTGGGYFLFATSGSTDTDRPTYSDHEHWEDYGMKIKQAYTAKFGGENTGFNEEVDLRVNSMIHNGRGWTRTQAYDWLKRMSKFTESKH